MLLAEGCYLHAFLVYINPGPRLFSLFRKLRRQFQAYKTRVLFVASTHARISRIGVQYRPLLLMMKHAICYSTFIEFPVMRLFDGDDN